MSVKTEKINQIRLLQREEEVSYRASPQCGDDDAIGRAAGQSANVYLKSLSQRQSVGRTRVDDTQCAYVCLNVCMCCVCVCTYACMSVGGWVSVCVCVCVCR